MKETNEGSDERDELNDLLDEALMQLVGENKIEMAFDENIQDYVFWMTPEQKKATY
jgi:hypothetical protein